MCKRPSRKCISLFSSAGLGELGLIKQGIEVIAANELVESRVKLYEYNYPSSKMFAGDIWNIGTKIVDYVDSLHLDELFLVYATPPCQGMSSNGIGKLLAEVSNGNRHPVDQRNRLIIPTMDVIIKLKPRWVLFENVPRMLDTTILDEHNHPVNIMRYVQQKLGSEYVGKGEVLSCSDYGIPQLRKRLITVFTRDEMGIDYFKANNNTFFPSSERKTEITLREAIGHLPPLQSEKGLNDRSDFHPLHYVQIMKPEKYWWVSNTKEGATAFNNQCVNPNCLFQGNKPHKDINNKERSQIKDSAQIYCIRCNHLLPRPNVLDKETGKRRAIRGFHSAYRRMLWDKPARAITRNFPYEASDNKIHPEQNRVLSAYEVLVLQTIADYSYKFEIDGKRISRKLFADIVGECVPPKLIDQIARKILNISNGLCT